MQTFDDQGALKITASTLFVFESVSTDADLGAANFVKVDATTSDVTLTLPAASASYRKSWIVIKVDNTSHQITIATQGLDLLNGETSFSFNFPFDSVMIVCDGAAFYIV